MYAVDFFCGAGGLTRGLSDAGIEVLAGIDADISCKETYECNNKPSKFIHADITRLSIKDVLQLMQSIPREELLFAACAPCQPFASLNRYGRNADATLLLRFMKIVEAIGPFQVFIENVSGLARVKGYSTYARFKNMLAKNGYNWVEAILDAKNYGIPQTRKRLVLIAMKQIVPTIPPATHGPNLIPYVTVRDSIQCYPEIRAGEQHPTLPNHQAASLSPTNFKRIMATPFDGGSRVDWPEELWLECHKGDHKGHTDVYGRMRWDYPSPTLTCRCWSISNGRYGHPKQNRAISLREAAKLQSFRDDYIFLPNRLKITALKLAMRFL